MKIRLSALALLACAGSSLAQPAQAPTPSSLVAAAKRLAGTQFDGTFTSICVANREEDPANGPTTAQRAINPPHRPIPDRASWYIKPYKAFDNLYFVGDKIQNSWALKTSKGIILIDTLYEYATGPEIVDGLKALKLDPHQVKYIIITHGHTDHDQGAAQMQSQFGSHLVISAPDWETILQRPADAPGGVPKRLPGDITVGPEGYKLTLGDATVNIFFTPGHTPGTLSSIFQVKDHGRPITVAHSGGTGFNFPHTAQNFQIYEDSQKKMEAAARAAGATVLISNHSALDNALDYVRMAQLPRAKGEPSPFEIGADAVQRYFQMTADCAEAERLSIK